MSESDDFGEIDDEALIFAATQADVSQVQDGFETSPRPSKRRRVERDKESDIDEDDILSGNQEFTGFPEDATQTGGAIVNGQDEEMLPPQRPKHHMYAPRIIADLDKVILDQTQIAAPSQPWLIRGPIWRRPKAVEHSQNGNPNTPVRGSEDVRIVDSDEENEMDVMEDRAARTSARKQSAVVLPS